MRWMMCAHVRFSVAMTGTVLASGFLLLKDYAVRAGDVASEVRIVPRRSIREPMSRQPQSPALYLTGQRDPRLNMLDQPN